MNSLVAPPRPLHWEPARHGTTLKPTTTFRVWTLPTPTVCVYRVGYDVTEVRQTDVYARWFAGLRDERARARIDVRIRRLSLGNASDARPVGEGVSELRIDYGPGYRVYFVRQGPALVVLLAGGDKGTQHRDIATARQLARGL